MSNSIRENVTRGDIWLRLIIMIVLGVAFNVAELVILAVSVFQFLVSLFTGEPNDHLTRFGRNLSRYIQQIIAYLSFASDDRPFPFSSWPDEPEKEVPETQSTDNPDSTNKVAEAQSKSVKSVPAKKRTTRKSPTGSATRKKSTK